MIAARFFHAPLPLLVLTGLLLGSALPMARIAHDAGIGTLAFASWPTLGAGLLLGLSKGPGIIRSLWGVAPYCLVAGFLGIAIPYAVSFAVAPHLGTSFTALAYTLPPLFTYVFALPAGLERFTGLRFMGILLGLTGAALLAFRHLGTMSGSAWWLLALLAVPVSVALGNVFRKMKLPHGVAADTLASGMLLAGALVLLPLVLTQPALAGPGPFAWLVLVLQTGLTSAGYACYFRLQRVADPVYFSQLGYVMAAAGVLAGIACFGERLDGYALAALPLIACGIALVNRRAPRQ